MSPLVSIVIGVCIALRTNGAYSKFSAAEDRYVVVQGRVEGFGSLVMWRCGLEEGPPTRTRE